MLGIARVKKLLGDESISDKKAEEIRDFGRALAGMVFTQWQKEIAAKRKASKFLKCSAKTE